MKWSAAAVALLFGVWLVFAVSFQRWPAAIIVRNEIEDASCSVAFSDGFTWSVDLKRGEEKFWLFIFGPPQSASATCRSRNRTFADAESFLCNGQLGAFTATFAINEGDGAEGEEIYCIMS